MVCAPAARRVACYVAKSPHRLLSHIRVRATDWPHESVDHTHSVCVVAKLLYAPRRAHAWPRHARAVLNRGRPPGQEHAPRLINMGTAPLSMTTRVCSEVPEETLVRVHAASKRSGALSSASGTRRPMAIAQSGYESAHAAACLTAAACSTSAVRFARQAGAVAAGPWLQG